MALTIQEIQTLITNKHEAREIINEIADYLQANPGGSSSYLVAEKILTDAQIKALPTTGIELVAAQGSGKIINPISAILSFNYVGNYTNINANCTISVLTNSFFPLTYLDNSLGTVTALLASGVSQFSLLTPAGKQDGAFYNSESFISSDVANLPLTLSAANGGAGNFTGGNAANTLKVKVYYVVVDL